MNESCHIYEAFISHIRMSRVSYMHQQCHAYACVMSHYRVAKTHISSRCRSFFAKEPWIVGLLCGKWPIKIRRPMTLRHPVLLYERSMSPA